MTHALIIGGGPAGASLATRLARAGREVVLLEREAGPVDKVCGEFLSHEAGFYLAALGLDLRALGALPIDAVRLCERGHVTTATLPFSALSLSRRVLDEALLARAASAGATIRRGVTVRELSRSSGGWAARVDRGAIVEAGDAFLATGKCDLRGHGRPPALQNDLIAFKMHWRLAPEQAVELAGHVELVLFDGGYAGLQPIEGGRANLCLVVRRPRFLALERGWQAVLSAICRESPHLASRLAGSQPCTSRPYALSAIPYGHVQRRSKGPWRLGDQAAVIPSFSGDGMSIALHSAELAANAYLQGASADVYQRRLARDVTRQVLLATAMSHGLVRRSGQAVLGVAARVWPGLMSTVASRTRVSDAALFRSTSGRATLEGQL